MKLYRFHWDCGRQGDVYGVFAAEPADVDAAIGDEVYFGEILGKHSEVYGTLGAEDIEVLTCDEAFIKQAIAYRLIPNGHNPMAARSCRECGAELGGGEPHRVDCSRRPAGAP